MALVLVRKGSEVFHDNKKLTIVPQATKGANKEVVKVAGLEGANGQKWVSLRSLKEGSNTLELKAREVVNVSSKSYSLTSDELAKVNALQAQIDAIINVAKARFVPKPSLNFDASKMTKEQREAKMQELKKYFGL